MESKILIDINYASRDPQILIHQNESDDPRDKLISMFTGHSMPGVRDGYCRIERYPTDQIVITPIHPVDLIDHIPTIAKFAEENAACDTSGVPERYRKIIEGEYRRVVPASMGPTMTATDKWLQKNLPHELYKRWVDEVLYPVPEQRSSQE